MITNTHINIMLRVNSGVTVTAYEKAALDIYIERVKYLMYY